jgi:membrane protein implicated in regulation of membrane protease activity
MIEIPLEDLVFVICTLVGGGLLLITVLVDDILGGIFDFLDISIGGASLMPLVLSFVAMFGVGGLFATQVLDLHGASAAAVGAVFGIGGATLAWVLFGFLQRSEARPPFTTSDLIGHEAYVAVGIPAGRWGSVYVKAEGQTHEFSATASTEITAGAPVTVTGVAGSGLVVEPRAVAAPPAEPPPAAGTQTTPSVPTTPPGA